MAETGRYKGNENKPVPVYRSFDVWKNSLIMAKSTKTVLDTVFVRKTLIIKNSTSSKQDQYMQFSAYLYMNQRTFQPLARSEFDQFAKKTEMDLIK